MSDHCLFFLGYEWKLLFLGNEIFEIPPFFQTRPGDLGKIVHACSLRFSALKAAAGEMTLAYSEIKRSLISAFHDAFIHALWLVYYFEIKDGSSLSSSSFPCYQRSLTTRQNERKERDQSLSFLSFLPRRERPLLAGKTFLGVWGLKGGQNSCLIV